MLCVARVEEQPVVAEFTSCQDTVMFHKRGRFGLEKKVKENPSEVPKI